MLAIDSIYDRQALTFIKSTIPFCHISIKKSKMASQEFDFFKLWAEAIISPVVVSHKNSRVLMQLLPTLCYLYANLNYKASLRNNWPEELCP